MINSNPQWNTCELHVRQFHQSTNQTTSQSTWRKISKNKGSPQKANNRSELPGTNAFKGQTNFASNKTFAPKENSTKIKQFLRSFAKSTWLKQGENHTIVAILKILRQGCSIAQLCSTIKHILQNNSFDITSGENEQLSENKLSRKTPIISPSWATKRTMQGVIWGAWFQNTIRLSKFKTILRVAEIIWGK